MSRTIIRKPAHRMYSASHLRSLLVSSGMSGLLSMRRGEVDMLFRPIPRENSSVRVDRAPLLVVTPPRHATRTTQARWAAAPPAPRLLLLPSGPDGVHGTRSRQDQAINAVARNELRTA